MKNIILLNTILQELSNFSGDVLVKGNELDEQLVKECEIKIGCNLPLDFKEFLKEYNGIEILGSVVYGINDTVLSIDKIYEFEHFDVENPMPTYLIPFSPDGAGNHYCFDTRFYTGESCQVVFWQHDYLYSHEDKPEIVNNSFLDWVKEVIIDWTLESFNYDGTEK